MLYKFQIHTSRSSSSSNWFPKDSLKSFKSKNSVPCHFIALNDSLCSIKRHFRVFSCPTTTSGIFFSSTPKKSLFSTIFFLLSVLFCIYFQVPSSAFVKSFQTNNCPKSLRTSCGKSPSLDFKETQIQLRERHQHQQDQLSLELRT